MVSLRRAFERTKKQFMICSFQSGHTSRHLLHNRQRMVLFECCNGNLQDEEVVAFWSSDPDAKLTEELTDVWVRRVVAALLPHKCP